MRALAQNAANRIDRHEAACAERYEGLLRSMARVEKAAEGMASLPWKILSAVGVACGIIAFILQRS